ncbi:DedA family protein [Actinoplanes sp. DH11]|uniref:DedA family protein n=1 Tax=Actinoplanes sp. DH11 TaxID=2857011 RepID=UPI001E4CE825|nr:DedA family protein [Actinoplanes sp. DH11]
MTDVAGLLAHLPPVAAYAVLACALLIESNLLVGVLVPTMTLMLSAGALARAGYLDLSLVVVVAASSVVIADLISHRTGRLLGRHLRTSSTGRRLPADAWARGEALMSRHGGRALLVSRFVPLLRTLLPHVAGATGMTYRRMAPYSMTAAVGWAAVEAGAGYAAATSLHRILTLGGPAVLALAVAVAAATAVASRQRRRRQVAQARAGATDTRPAIPAG